MSKFSIPISKPKAKTYPEKIAIMAKDLEGEHPTQSKAIALLSTAMVQVEMTIGKADEALNQLTANLENVKAQKIGLVAQKTMLAELKNRLIEIEAVEVKEKQAEPKQQAEYEG